MSHHIARRSLVKEISEKGIKDPRVLEAIYNTPRHIFVDSIFKSRAYKDMSLPIGHKQTISQPFIVAKMTEILIQGNVLEQRPLGNVLEVGTGCGYQAAVLSNFCKRLYSAERIEALSLRAKKNLKSLDIKNVVVKFSDIKNGWPEKKYFDAIICTAAIPDITNSLLEQLKINGKLIFPKGNNSSQNLVLITKKRKGKIEEEILDKVLFVPMLDGEVEINQ
tara:strand:- start:17 stop:679 length:663 start_codon:yes stop_codon:yes gene_type:complete